MLASGKTCVVSGLVGFIFFAKSSLRRCSECRVPSRSLGRCGFDGACCVYYSFPRFSVPPSYCLVHEGYMVELQILVQQQHRDVYQ